MVQVSVPITLGVFAPLLAIVLITQRLQTRVERYRAASRTASSVVAGAIGDLFGAVQGSRSTTPRNGCWRISGSQWARRQAVVRGLLTQLVNALAGNMVVVGTALVLLFSARAIGAGHFTVGDFASLSPISGRSPCCCKNMANQITLINRVRWRLAACKR